jgi:hypothetical protein
VAQKPLNLEPGTLNECGERDAIGKQTRIPRLAKHARRKTPDQFGNQQTAAISLSSLLSFVQDAPPSSLR